MEFTNYGVDPWKVRTSKGARNFDLERFTVWSSQCELHHRACYVVSGPALFNFMRDKYSSCSRKVANFKLACFQWKDCSKGSYSPLIGQRIVWPDGHFRPGSLKLKLRHCLLFHNSLETVAEVYCKLSLPNCLHSSCSEISIWQTGMQEEYAALTGTVKTNPMQMSLFHLATRRFLHF